TGFGGTITSATTATTTFSGIEQFTDGATISGRVFTDTNGNGTQDTGETGIAGATVQLDLNLDGTADLTTTTNAAGDFSFTGLSPGTYRVRVTLQSGQSLTTTLPADITATLGQVTQNVNFGVGTAVSVGGTVTGVVYNDANKN